MNTMHGGITDKE